jgi:hypothetical protein
LPVKVTRLTSGNGTVGVVSIGRSLKRAQDMHTGSIKLIPTSLHSHHIRTSRDFIMTVLSLATVPYTQYAWPSRTGCGGKVLL